MEEQTAREGVTEREGVRGEKERRTNEWWRWEVGGDRKRLKQAADREQRLKGWMEDEREQVKREIT